MQWYYPDPDNNARNIIKSVFHFFSALLIIGLGWVPSIALAADPDLELAQKLIAKGQPAEAYNLLEPYEFEQAGNANFDYLLGLAALNSGQADTASIILERVLIVDPLHAAAHLDLGKAYFLLGDIRHARTEFLRAQSLKPPPSAQETIRHYLDSIDTTDEAPENRSSGYIEVGIGHNNNVNNATTQNQIAIPALLDIVFTLNSANVKTADNYIGLATGGEVIHPISRDFSVYAGIDLHDRSGLKYPAFDYFSLDGRVGAIYSKNAEQFQGGMVAGKFYQGGGSVNRNSSGFNAEWRHSYSNANQAVLFGQYLRYRYPDPALISNDFNQAVAGLGWLHVFSDGRSSVYGSIFAGKERDTNLRIDGGKSIRGTRLSWQASLAEGLYLFAAGGVQKGMYDHSNSAFLVKRDDRQEDLTVGLTYRYRPDWLVRPQITYVRNYSNIIVNRYDQVDFSVTLRRDFK